MAVRITCGECGWRSSACRSQGQADYALRRHSCKKELARQAAARRGRARKAAVDRTPKPCLHKIARHEHGTHACYVLDRCRCLSCAAANSAYEKNRAKLHAYGRFTGLVDAEPTRQHVRSLMAAGIGLKRITALSGVSAGVLNKLLYGSPRTEGNRRPPCKRITWETAVRLQTIRPGLDTLAAGALVDATGTRRRIQALVALGWSQSKVAERLGMTRSNFGHTLTNVQIRLSTARAVTALYDELWDTRPPAETHRDKIALSRTLRYAREHNFAPPLAWDADTIDDPAASPIGWTPPTPRCDECARIFGNRGALIAHAKLRHGSWPSMLGPDPSADGWDELDAADYDQADEGVDEVLVERIMAGTYRVPHNAQAPELVEAVRRLATRGHNDYEIGALIGRSVDAVLKTRQRNDIPSPRSIAVIASRFTPSEDGNTVSLGGPLAS